MLRMSKHADYGIVLLSHFAHGGEGNGEAPPALSARDLAEGSGLPQPTVAKILKQLTRAGILSSQRGANGGYHLTRSAAELTVADILEALEGPIGLVECSAQGPVRCSHERDCPVRRPLQRLNHAVRQTLQNLTLGELVASA